MTTNFRTWWAALVLAIGFSGACGTALAGPIYHVSIDTSRFQGSGYLGLAFGALSGAAPATAVLGNFSGDPGGDPVSAGDVSGDIGSSLVFGNGSSDTEWLQGVNFGGDLAFDISFDMGDVGDIGSSFTVSLINAAMDDYVAGTVGNFIVFDLLPGAPDSLSVAGDFAQVNAIPEPAGPLLFMTGLAMLMIGVRHGRQARG